MLHAAGGCFPTKKSVLKSVANVRSSCWSRSTRLMAFWRRHPGGTPAARAAPGLASPASPHSPRALLLCGLSAPCGRRRWLRHKVQWPSLTPLPLKRSLLELRSLVFLCRYGRFHGRRRETSGLGRPRGRPQPAAHPQLPPAAGDVVPRGAQDHPQQQNVSVPDSAVQNTLMAPVSTMCALSVQVRLQKEQPGPWVYLSLNQELF